MSINIMAKHLWACEEPNITLRRLSLPVNTVVFNYPSKNYTRPKSKRSPGNTPSWSECLKEIKYLHKGDVNGRYKDIRYNFLIGPGGAVFEGRGWYREPSLPHKLFHLTRRCLYIALLGDYTVGPPSDELFKTRQAFMEYAVKNEYASPKCLEFTLRCS